MNLHKEIVTQLIRTDQILHNWARLLSQAGYKLVPFQPDHSLANFGWNSLKDRLEGSEFLVDDSPYFIAFSPDEYAFTIINSNNVFRKIEIEDMAWDKVVNELEIRLTSLGIRQVELHKDLEFRFPKWFNDKDISDIPDPQALQLWKIARTGANQVLENTVNTFNQSSEIRIWATNFDTGIFCDFGNGSHQYAGFSSADKEVVDQPYFYNSFYKKNERDISV